MYVYVYVCTYMNIRSSDCEKFSSKFVVVFSLFGKTSYIQIIYKYI